MPFNLLLDYRSPEWLAAMDYADRKELLREVLSHGPSTDTWSAVLELFAMWPDDAMKLATLDEADAAMSGWDESLRALDSSRLFERTQLSWLARIVRSMSMYRSGARGDTELRGLATSPHVARLTRLAIVRCEIGRGAWQAMTTSPHLSHLRSLQVSSTLMLADSFERLIQDSHLPSLHALEINEGGVDARALRAVAHATPPFALRHLDLSHNVLGDDGALALAESAWLSSVEILALRRTLMHGAGMQALLSSTLLQCLQRIDLRDNVKPNVNVTALRHIAAVRGIELLA